jgi:hypothetical protein
MGICFATASFQEEGDHALASPGGKDGADPAADEMAVFRGSVATWRLVDDVVDALPTEEGTKAAHSLRLDATMTATVLANNLIF